MGRHSSIYRDYDKVKNVIKSCDNLKQLLTSIKIARLFSMKYRRFENQTNYLLVDDLDHQISIKDSELRKRLT